MADIANRDEALKCVSIARRALADGDDSRAEKFAQKAARLYSCPEVDLLLADLHRGAGSTANGSSNGAGTPQSADEADDGSGGGASGLSPGQAGAKPQRPAASMHGFARQRGSGLAGSSLNDQGTAEQRQLVGQILKAKDFYEILAIEKTATDDDIKKGYRKLALKLHPDKNKAPRAEDAFKAVSKAFSCLSDPQKRAYYDRTGFESSGAAAAATNASMGGRRAGAQYSDGAELDPEQIFNMFFGGGFNPQARVFRTHFGNQRGTGGGRAPPPTAEQAQRNALFNLVQFLPVLLILFLSIFSSFNTPVYNLNQSHSYPAQVLTERLNVPFFVKDAYDFDKTHPAMSSVRTRLERQVESDFYEKLSNRCQAERLEQNRLWTWGRTREARSMTLPSCAEMDRMNAKLGVRNRGGSLYSA